MLNSKTILTSSHSDSGILISELPLTIERPLEDQVAIKGESVAFKCTLSKEAASVKWLKDGKEIQSNEKLSMSRDGLEWRLAVGPCGKADAGRYSLVCDGVETTASLVVKGSSLLRLVAASCKLQTH